MKPTKEETMKRDFGRRRSFGIFVALICLLAMLPLSTFGADKLIVKDGANATRFVVNTNDNSNVGFLGLNVATPTYHFDLSSSGTAKSSMHFSKDGTDAGGWITSVADNNFFVSSGAVYDQSAGGSGWVQKSSDGKAVMAGSGGMGYRVFTSSGTSVGAVLPTPSTRFHIDYSGNVGINRLADATKAIDTSTGAYLSSGGKWTDSSSRQYKENIRELSSKEAMEALRELNPVTFTYKADPDEQNVGFIAEDVPALVATKDRKGLSAMDIVAVLTKVVQEQEQTVKEQRSAIEILTEKLTKLEAELNRLKSKDMTARIIGQE